MSKWRPVTSRVPQGSVLGLVLFNIFVSDTEGRTECTLSKFADNTKLCGAVDMPEGRDTIQRDLDRLQRWAPVNLVKFSKAKWKVLHMRRGNPKDKYRMGREWIESSPEKKDLGVLVDQKLNMTRQCVLAVQKANRILGCIPSSMASRAREGILPLCSCESPPGVLRPALEPSAQETHGPVGVGPEKATKMIRGLEHLSCEERLREMGLFSLEKRRLQRDLIAAFQYLKGPTRELERDFLQGPVVTGQGNNGFKLRQGRFRSGVRKKLFTVREVRPWHKLPREAVAAPSLAVFKARLDWT